MASGNSNASSNNSSSTKEQLLVCWLEPQSDAGKVSAIPPSWIVSTVSGDGRSPNSVVRCRWPRTKRLYRARIVSSADQQSKSAQDENEEEEDEDTGSGVESVEKKSKEEPNHEESPMVASANMVKEEPKSTRNSHTQQSSTPMATIVTTAPVSNQQATPVPAAAAVPHPSPAMDAAALAQALLPTLKKLFNSELSKLSTDIQANFDIIGHKISALDGTVKCIKTRVDRMETLLNTAAQELGDNQTSATTSPSVNNLSLTSINASSLNNTDLLSGAARSLNLASVHQNNANSGGGFYSAQQQNRNAAASNPANRYSAMSNSSATPRTSVTAAAAHALSSQQLQQNRRPVAGGNRIGIQQAAASYHTPVVSNRPSINSVLSSFSRQTPNSMVSQQTLQRPQNSGAVAGSSSKRRRTTTTTNPVLPKAVVITAPNGVEIYLGGDKNYKMPLVMYKDALKNCTRPIATYMVMALIRRYLTPDEMSRTWLTEQQLLGKKDGILLDQNLLTALKKQALMQFPGSGIDDRLLVRKLYDVFHGIRRQMRKKRREAGDLGFGQASLLGTFGNERGGAELAGMGDAAGDDDSGSGNEQDEGMDDDHHIEQGSGGFDDEQANDFEGDDYGHEEHESGGMDDNEEGHLNLEPGDDADDGLMGDNVLNGDEDLEEMAAKQAAFWAGTDENY